MLADREFNIVHDDRDAPIECETGSLDLPETGAVDALATYICPVSTDGLLNSEVLLSQGEE